MVTLNPHYFLEFLFICFHFYDKSGLDVEGLFRISASSAEMKKWIELFDNGLDI